MKRADNHIDDPHKFRPAKCPCCQKCWVHIETGRCICGGPFDGYTGQNSPLTTPLRNSITQALHLAGPVDSLRSPHTLVSGDVLCFADFSLMGAQRHTLKRGA